MSTWLVVGASRGIGLELVKQLLARGDRVFATVRDRARASQLWSLTGAANRGACQLLECDVRSDESISVSWRLQTTLRICRLIPRRNSLKSYQASKDFRE